MFLISKSFFVFLFLFLFMISLSIVGQELVRVEDFSCLFDETFMFFKVKFFGVPLFIKEYFFCFFDKLFDFFSYLAFFVFFVMFCFFIVNSGFFTNYLDGNKVVHFNYNGKILFWGIFIICGLFLLGFFPLYKINSDLYYEGFFFHFYGKGEKVCVLFDIEKIFKWSFCKEYSGIMNYFMNLFGLSNLVDWVEDAFLLNLLTFKWYKFIFVSDFYEVASFCFYFKVFIPLLFFKIYNVLFKIFVVFFLFFYFYYCGFPIYKFFPFIFTLFLFSYFCLFSYVKAAFSFSITIVFFCLFIFSFLSHYYEEPVMSEYEDSKYLMFYVGFVCFNLIIFFGVYSFFLCLMYFFFISFSFFFLVWFSVYSFLFMYHCLKIKEEMDAKLHVWTFVQDHYDVIMTKVGARLSKFYKGLDPHLFFSEYLSFSYSSLSYKKTINIFLICNFVSLFLVCFNSCYLIIWALFSFLFYSFFFSSPFSSYFLTKEDISHDFEDKEVLRNLFSGLNENKLEEILSNSTVSNLMCVEDILLIIGRTIVKNNVNMELIYSEIMKEALEGFKTECLISMDFHSLIWILSDLSLKEEYSSDLEILWRVPGSYTFSFFIYSWNLFFKGECTSLMGLGFFGSAGIFIWLAWFLFGVSHYFYFCYYFFKFLLFVFVFDYCFFVESKKSEEEYLYEGEYLYFMDFFNNFSSFFGKDLYPFFYSFPWLKSSLSIVLVPYFRFFLFCEDTYKYYHLGCLAVFSKVVEVCSFSFDLKSGFSKSEFNKVSSLVFYWKVDFVCYSCCGFIFCFFLYFFVLVIFFIYFFPVLYLFLMIFILFINTFYLYLTLTRFFNPFFSSKFSGETLDFLSEENFGVEQFIFCWFKSIKSKKLNSFDEEKNILESKSLVILGLKYKIRLIMSYKKKSIWFFNFLKGVSSFISV